MESALEALHVDTNDPQNIVGGRARALHSGGTNTTTATVTAMVVGLRDRRRAPPPLALRQPPQSQWQSEGSESVLDEEILLDGSAHSPNGSVGGSVAGGSSTGVRMEKLDKSSLTSEHLDEVNALARRMQLEGEW